MKTITFFSLVAFWVVAIQANAQYSAQKYNTSSCCAEVGVSQVVTCSSYGYLTVIKANFGIDKTNFGVGAIIQNDYKKPTGIYTEMNIVVFGDEFIDLYFNSTINFYYMSKLSKKMNKLIHAPSFFKDLDMGDTQFEKYNTLECFVGFGLLFNLSPKMTLNTGIGFGGYYSMLQTEDYRLPNTLWYEDAAIGQIFKLGLSYKIK